MLLSQDRAAISAAVANASSAASLSEIRYFTQRGLFSTRILDAMGIARLRDDLDQLTTTALRWRAAAGRTEALRDNIARRFHRRCCSTVARKPKTSATKSCATRHCRGSAASDRTDARADPPDARRLRERYSKPRKRQRRGHLDVRRTIRRNAAWGGVPFLTAWKRRRRDRPRIVALCDVSGSVARVSISSAADS